MTDLTVTAAQVGAVYADADITTVIATEAITEGQPLYQVAATGKFGIADANATGKMEFRGIALEKGQAGQAISILRCGALYGYDLSGLNYDARVYLSDTAGKLADAAGTISVIVGRVVALPDSSLTKVLWVEADWLRAWSS